jgi:ubiquinone biosynthesis protein COQ4
MTIRAKKEISTMEDVAKLSPVERWTRALKILAHVMVNPEETEQVLEFSTLVNAGSMGKRIDLFLGDPEGRRLYDEHRSIDSHTIDLAALAALPEGTLGRAYAHFLTSRGLTPEVFDDPPAEITDPRIQYIVQRIRQTHDLWHVVTGCNTDPAGEIALQAFTFAQLGAPSTLILAVAGTLRGRREAPTLPRDVLAAYRTGRHAGKLATFPWEDHWTTPLVEVRAMLGLPLQPRAAA